MTLEEFILKNKGYRYDDGERLTDIWLHPMMQQGGMLDTLGALGGEDSRQRALDYWNKYYAINNATDSQGRKAWGEMGTLFGDDGQGWGDGKVEGRFTDLNGKEIFRTGSDASGLFRKGGMTEKLLLQKGIDPSSLVSYDPSVGYYMDAGLRRALDKVQSADMASQEDMLDSGTFLGSLAMMPFGAAMAAASGAAAAGGAGSGALSLPGLGSISIDALIPKLATSAFSAGAGGGNPLIGAATGAIGTGLGNVIPNLTGIPGLDNILKAGITGGVTSAIKGTNPVQGALGGALGGVGGLFPTTSSAVAGWSEELPAKISEPFVIDTDPLNYHDDLKTTQAQPMDDFDWENIFSDGTPFDPNVVDADLEKYLADIGGGFGMGGQDDLDKLLADLKAKTLENVAPGSPLMNQLDSAAYGKLGALAPLLKTLLGNNGASSLNGVLGGGGLAGLLGSGGLFGGDGALGLAARIAPGMAALNFAQNQSSVSTDPLSNLLQTPAAPSPSTANLQELMKGYSGFDKPYDTSAFNNISNGASSLGRAFDTSGLTSAAFESQNLGRGFNTSRFNDLYGQVSNMMDPYKSNVLQDYDMRSGQARGDLLSSLERRGVSGSSFGNMDVANFDTTTGVGRGRLAGELGLQGVAAQRGLSQDMLGAEQSQRAFEQAGLGLRANIANQVLGAQNAARGFEQAGLGLGLNAANATAGLETQRRQFGLNALTGASGVAKNIADIDLANQTFGLNRLNSQANIASQLINSQLQQKAIQSALYGRAFDVLGRAVSPSTSLFGR